MTNASSLRSVLARQWAAYTIVLFSAFLFFCVLLLYVLEDNFINRHLKDTANSIRQLHSSMLSEVVLPVNFTLYSTTAIAPEIAEKMAQIEQGNIREFRLLNARYIHATKIQSQDGQWFFLVYDVTDDMVVNPTLYRGIPYIVLFAFVLALLAYGLAFRFTNKISAQAESFLHKLANQTDVDNIRHLGQSELISEFRFLAQLNANAIEKQQQALNREHQTLSFMAHELRTPLQSLRTNISILNEHPQNNSAWLRVQRACARLVRASNSVLWLSEPQTPMTNVQGDVNRVITTLQTEFAPFFAKRAQTLILAPSFAQNASGVFWPLPLEIIETVIANLMFNALQHGAAGEVVVHYDETMLVVRNACQRNTVFQDNPSEATQSPNAHSFGIGLTIVERLLARFNWQLAYENKDNAFIVRIFQ